MQGHVNRLRAYHSPGWCSCKFQTSCLHTDESHLYSFTLSGLHSKWRVWRVWTFRKAQQHASIKPCALREDIALAASFFSGSLSVSAFDWLTRLRTSSVSCGRPLNRATTASVSCTLRHFTKHRGQVAAFRNLYFVHFVICVLRHSCVAALIWLQTCSGIVEVLQVHENLEASARSLSQQLSSGTLPSVSFFGLSRQAHLIVKSYTVKPHTKVLSMVTYSCMSYSIGLITNWWSRHGIWDSRKAEAYHLQSWILQLQMYFTQPIHPVKNIGCCCDSICELADARIAGDIQILECWTGDRTTKAMLLHAQDLQCWKQEQIDACKNVVWAAEAGECILENVVAMKRVPLQTAKHCQKSSPKELWLYDNKPKNRAQLSQKSSFWKNLRTLPR